MVVEEEAEALNPKILLPVLAVANDWLTKGEPVRLPKIVSFFSVLAVTSIGSAVDTVDTVETEFVGATDVVPDWKMGAVGNEGPAAEVDRLPLEAAPLATTAVVEGATVVKLFVKD